MMRLHIIIIWLISIIGVAIARDVVKLEAVNFELAITSYPYVAILFYDESEESKILEANWETAASELGDFYMDGEMGKINTADPDVKEVMDAYRLSSPSIKVFRRGSMADYRGPGDAKGILEYIKQDSQPSVVTLSSLDDVKSTLEKKALTIVLGFFSSTEASVDSADVYALDSWGQFQAAADALRSHAAFYVISSESVMRDFGVKVADTPLIYLIPVESEGLLAYSGEYLEAKIIEWVLRNSAPSVGELTFTSTAGEVYATQFFSSKLYKFILFLPPGDRYKHESALASWKDIASGYKKKAIFSYIIGNTVQDVLDYFDVDLSSDVPVIVAHSPTKDQKYKSQKKIALTSAVFQEFVSGVLGGKVSHVFKSEPVPKTQKGNVVKAVGTTVVSLVNQTDRDVLLEVYAPWCGHCKLLAPTYEILGKAMQAEDRIVIAKIDGSSNDIPPAWGVKNFPTLLWFPASSKPYKSGIPVPKPYWDAGTSLQELVGFVIRESSFDAKSLRVATSEQLGSLLGEEETLRELYEKEDRWAKRNEGRKVNENKVLDYIHGEIVFDGKRSHIIVAGVVAFTLLSCCCWLTVLLMKKNSVVGTSSSSSSKKKNT